MPKRLFGLNALNLAVLFFLAITSGPAFAQTAATGALKVAAIRGIATVEYRVTDGSFEPL